jgi:hypothetical protein
MKAKKWISPLTWIGREVLNDLCEGIGDLGLDA